MDSGTLITLEMAGVLGVVLALGGWELYSLRRDKARDAQAHADTPSADPDEGKPVTPSSTGST